MSGEDEQNILRNSRAQEKHETKSTFNGSEGRTNASNRSTHKVAVQRQCGHASLVDGTALKLCNNRRIWW